MTAFDFLLIATASALGLGASALATRPGAERALALLLSVNALLCVRALAWSVDALAFLRADAVGVGALALLASLPPLLALAARRARTGGPLVRGDWRYGLPSLAVLVASAPMLAWTVGVGAQWAIQIAFLVALNVLAVWCFRSAWRDAHRVPQSARRVGVQLVGVFALHWTFSSTSWAVSLSPLPREASLVAEFLSVGSLLAFGVYAAWVGLRRLPSIPDPPPPPDPLVEQADERLAARLRDVLWTDARYLDPELTAETLADAVREPSRDVSRVLGARLGDGFYDVVGRLRVAHAQRLLIAEPDVAVLDIAYRSGFNSKSAFHRAFKQHAATTPSAFRKTGQPPLDIGFSGDGAIAVPLPVSGRQGA